MILSIIVLLILAGIAYWHYAQGLFSATFSAISAIIAAAIALSYQEPLVNSLFHGAMPDYANAVAMVALFAITYIILRTVFDNLVPGNIRLPVWVDRIGGGAMGVIAGIFATGIFVLAAESLPFGPSIGGYSRYPIDDDRLISILVPGNSQQQDIDIPDQLKEDRFEPASQKSLIIPVDDIVVAAVQRFSAGGALAGQQPLESVHPDYPDELFGQRLGIQVSGKHVALNLPGSQPQVTVPDPGVFHFDKDVAKSQIDGEQEQVHQRPITYKPAAPDDYPLVVRVLFSHEAADIDGLVRLSCGSVHLVADDTDYWPVGTVQNGSLIYLNKIDDPLLISTKGKDHAADFIFFVDPKKVMTGDEKAKEQKIRDGVFISVKRGVLIDLGGRTVQPSVTPSPTVEVMRKPAVEERARKMGFDTESVAVNPSAAPISIQNVLISDQLCAPINVGTADKSARDVQIKASGTCSFQNQKFTKLNLEPADTIRVLSTGSFGIQTLFVPPGQSMVQVSAQPPAEGGDGWAWARNLQQFTLADSRGRTYRPVGAWAKVMDNAAERLAASYDSSGGAASINPSQGRPTDLWIAFLVPSGTQLRDLSYQGQPIKAVNLTAQ